MPRKPSPKPRRAKPRRAKPAPQLNDGHLIVRLPSADLAEFRARAKTYGMTMSELVRKAISRI